MFKFLRENLFIIMDKYHFSNGLNAQQQQQQQKYTFSNQGHTNTWILINCDQL